MTRTVCVRAIGWLVFASVFAMPWVACCKQQDPIRSVVVAERTGIAVQRAIDDLSKTGGGRVVLTRGVYQSGTIRLRSNIELHLEEGAVLSGGKRSEDYEDVIPQEEIYSYDTSNPYVATRKAFVYAAGAQNIAITGPGVIDSHGPAFFDHSTVLWKYFWQKPACMRPRMVVFIRCKGVHFSETTFKDSPTWTMWLRECEDIVVSGIRVMAEQKMINSDGIDFDACRNVRVGDSYFKTGDDCLVLRAIRRACDDGKEVITENVVVSNCYLNTFCQGVRIGCPSDDTIRQAVFRDIVFEGNNAISAEQPTEYLVENKGFLKTDNIVFENWKISCFGRPIVLSVEDGIALRDFGHFTFRDLTVESGLPLLIAGGDSTMIRDIHFENVHGTVKSDHALLLKHIDGLELTRIGFPEPIWVSGTNRLERTILLDRESSGCRFVGENGALLSGGVRLGPWREVDEDVWEADAPRNRDGSAMFFDQLWVNGRRAQCARLPNEGYLRIRTGAIVAQTNTVTGEVFYRESVVFSNDVAAVLADVPEVDYPYLQMCMIHKWCHGRRRLVAYDQGKREVTVEAPWDWEWDWQRWCDRFTLVWFENVRSAFDASGEWFLDMSAGKVLYRPLPGEDLVKAEVVAPNREMTTLVEFRGDPKKGILVENVTFRNITFAHSAAESETNGPRQIRFYQAAQSSGGTISLAGAHNCTFENCRIAHTGNYAMRFRDGCVSNRVVGCVLEDLGAGGIWMGEEKERKVPRQEVFPDGVPTATAYNLVSNCTIRAAGRYNPEGTGIALAHCSDTKVLGCDIHDLFYTGVSVGWVWGYGGSVAQRNEIGFNRIYDLGKGIQSDMGGVYTLGTSFGTRVHGNVICDVNSFSYGGWGLYCDEGSEGIVMENNLVYNTSDGCFHQHFGRDNIIRNNIFLFNRINQAVRLYKAKCDAMPSSLHFVNNIVVTDGCPLTGGRDAGKVAGVWANNVWWDMKNKGEASFNGLKFDEWKRIHNETGSILANPEFVDVKGGDWMLLPSSPALRLGFQQLENCRPVVRSDVKELN